MIEQRLVKALNAAMRPGHGNWKPMGNGVSCTTPIGVQGVSFKGFDLSVHAIVQDSQEFTGEGWVHRQTVRAWWIDMYVDSPGFGRWLDVSPTIRTLFGDMGEPNRIHGVERITRQYKSAEEAVQAAIQVIASFYARLDAHKNNASVAA